MEKNKLFKKYLGCYSISMGFFSRIAKFFTRVISIVASFIPIITPVKAEKTEEEFKYEDYIDTNQINGHNDIINHFIFSKFINEFNKTYTLGEYVLKIKVFIENLQSIKKHNMDSTKTYKLGVNTFADLTWNEFSNKYLSTKAKISSGCKNYIPPSTITLSSIDWVSKGAVTPIKDQAQCGSCYAFSSTGVLEGVYEIKNNKLVSFSEQQIVDCSTQYGNDGCDGGLITNSLDYIKDNGLCSEADYPYKEVVGKCKRCTPVVGSKISECYNVPDNEFALTTAIQNQPVGIAIDAEMSFQFYKSGVYANAQCDGDLDHAVLAVGFGHDGTSGLDYYRVKNSWGLTWGESGYIRMKRNSSPYSTGLCGLAKMATFATL